MNTIASAARAADRSRGARRLMLAAGCAIVCLVSLPARAGIEPSPFQVWSDAFLLRATGPFDNPLVWFGFNPQRDPLRVLRSGEYPPDEVFPNAAPTIVIDVPEGTDPTSQGFEILFAMSEGLRVSAPADPGGTGSFAFELLDPTSGAKAFDVFFDISTSGGGVVASESWTFFNPQPEPPAFAAGSASAGFAFNLTSFSRAQVVMRIEDSQGNALSFTDVPEPATAALLGFAVAMLGFRRRRVSGRR